MNHIEKRLCVLQSIYSFICGQYIERINLQMSSYKADSLIHVKKYTHINTFWTSLFSPVILNFLFNSLNILHHHFVSFSFISPDDSVKTKLAKKASYNRKIIFLSSFQVCKWIWDLTKYEVLCINFDKLVQISRISSFSCCISFTLILHILAVNFFFFDGLFHL